MKVLIIADFTAPYRIEVFRRLSIEFETTTFFNIAKNESRNPDWYQKATEEFYFEVLDNEKAINHYNECVKNIKDFDLVLCYDPWAKRSRKLQRRCMQKKIPCILNADGAVTINMGVLKRLVKSFYVKRATMCFAGCNRAVEYFEAYGAKPQDIVKHPFTSLLKNQIRSSTYTNDEKAAFKQELGIEQKTMFLTVGQFIHRKGFDILLDAWRKTSQTAQLYIIGGGPLEDEYKRLIDENNLLNVHIIGFKKPNELLKYYGAADVFVLPTREDIWGLVINEALASGLPTISSNKCTAGNELITNGYNGYVYDCNNTNELASYVDELTNDETKRQEFAKNALKSISEYNIENVVSGHVDCIYKAINGK